MYLIKNFLHNKTGAISVIGVLAFSFSFSFMGALIDYSLMLKRKGDLQDSIDTTATWLVSHYGMLFAGRKNIDPEEIEKFAQEHFKINFRPASDEKVNLDITLPNNDDPKIRFEVSLDYKPLLFDAFHFIVSDKIQKEYTLKAVSEAHLSDFIEAALVLDVSGPVSNSASAQYGARLLKEAATHFIDIMTEKSRSYFRVALVPFDTFVNVGSQYTPSPEKPYYFMDPYARSPKHWAHFDFPVDRTNRMILHPSNPDRKLALKKDSLLTIYVREGYGWDEEERGKRINRFDLLNYMEHYDLDKIHSMRWKGCVEAPLYPYNVSDAYDPHKPESLFIPTFYPDHPIDVSNHRMINYWPDTPYLHDVGSEFYETLSPENKEIYSFYYPSGNPNYASLNSFGLIFNDVRKYFIHHDIDSYKLEAKKQRFNFIERDTNNEVGPNLFCNSFPIVLLKTPFFAPHYEQLADSIKRLRYTYAHANLTEGLVWGWRLLSHEHPFTQGAPYSKKNVHKMIVLISDGMNEFFSLQNEFDSIVKCHEAEYSSIYKRLYQNQNLIYYLSYNAYGYGHYAIDQIKKAFVKRLKEKRPIFHNENSLSKHNYEMDNQTYEACENIKQQGITIIVIGLGVKRNSNAEELMKACASSLPNRIKQKKDKLKKMYWYADESSLKDIFVEISQITAPFRFVK